MVATVDLSGDAQRTIVLAATLLLQGPKEISEAVADAVAADAVRSGIARVEVEHVERVAGGQVRVRCAGHDIVVDDGDVLVGAVSTCSPELREYHGLPAR